MTRTLVQTSDCMIVVIIAVRIAGGAQCGYVVLWECYGLQSTNAYLARLLEVSALVCRLIPMERAAASYHGCSCSFTDDAPRFLRRTETAGALPPFATLLAIRTPQKLRLASCADFRSQLCGTGNP